MQSDPQQLVSLSVSEFLQRLASETPTPGGGAAAGVSGALAAALGCMVCALTIGRPKFAAVEPRVRELHTSLDRSRRMLEELIDEDAAAYGELSAAFKLPKDDASRGERVRAAAEVAASVPLQTGAIARAVMDSLCDLREIGNPNLRSDVEAGIHMAHAAMHAAAENVRANLSFVTPEAATRLGSTLDQLLASSA